MTQHQVHDAIATGRSGLGALLWLMPSHIDAVTATLRPDLGWSVDQHVGYDGAVMIVATNDRIDRVFAMSGSEGRIELAHVHGDRMATCGVFSSMQDVLDQVASLAGNNDVVRLRKQGS